MGFAYEYTYQDCEYIIRTINTKHALAIHMVFPLLAALSRSKHICDQVT